MSKRFAVLVSICLALAATPSVRAVTLTLGSNADTYIPNNDATAHGSATYMYLHDTQNSVAYLRFDLAAANVTTVQSATLTLYTSGGAPRNDNVVSARVFLRGLNNVPGNTPQNWDEATLSSDTVGAEWKTNNGEPLINVTDMDDATAGAGMTETITLVGANYYDVGGIRIVITGTRLVEFLQSRVDDNGLATFLIDFPASTTGRGFGLASKEHATETLRPVLTLEATTGPKTAAINPSPADKAVEVGRDAVLSWTPGTLTVRNNVYLGAGLDAVTAADASVLVGPGQDANSYDPPGSLAFGQTYYWRADGVGAAPGATIYPGPVWRFTVEPRAYPIANVVATASSFNAGSRPENTVNRSGLNADDQHSAADVDMWFSGKGVAGPIWIQFALDRVYKLHEMWVWNYNTTLEGILGGGAKDVAIEYSTNGSDWTLLGETVFNQAPGSPTYTHNTTVDLEGVAAQYVKLTLKSNWGGMVPQSGLSEVRFFHIPVLPTAPVPAAATANVEPRSLVLSWKSGREAVSHEIHLGTDMQAVTNSITPVATATEAGYTPSALNLDTTYYWKVVEVNDAETPAAWAGDVWSFSTPSFLVIDDFESYTDIEGQRIYQSWADGWDDPANGSVVGYSDAPFAERTTTHSGRQSMPLAYDNTGAAARAEAKLAFEAPQDWTRHGVQTLVLFFRGQTSNSPAALYLKINDTKVAFNNGAPATTTALWKQWNIDLAASGANLQSVKSLTIGVEGSGAGQLFLDDIRLYATAPAVINPVDPGAAGLVALYALNGNLQDTSGRNYHGAAAVGVMYDAGYAGQAAVFNGTDTYVSLPIGPLVASLTDMTIATHVNFSGGAGSWQRIFDFGSGTTVYMFLSPRQSTGGAMRFAIRTAAVAEQVVDSPAAMPTGWHHAAVAIDSQTMTMKLYLDGNEVGSAATTLLPKDLGNTTQNWLGRSQWTADAYFSGMLDEFRIYDRTLSAAEVRYLAGDR